MDKVPSSGVGARRSAQPLGAMRYHDFHLREYRVSDFGKRISLHLVYDYAGKPREESHIEFSEVALYDFTHTGGAIVTDIEEATLSDLFNEVGGALAGWHAQQGVAGWKDSLDNYRKALESTGHKAWRIDSAIGFTLHSASSALPIPTTALGETS